MCIIKNILYAKKSWINKITKADISNTWRRRKKKVKMFLELIVHLTLFMVCINNTSKFAYPKMRRRMFPFK